MSNTDSKTARSDTASKVGHDSTSSLINDTPQKPKLVVIDDEIGPRESVKAVLCDQFDVMAFSSGHQALEHLKQNAADVAVVDIRMPDLNGIDVLRSLKQSDPNLEVVILTAYETLDTARDAIRYGASDYLNKPFDVRVMRETVNRCLQNRMRRLSSMAELELLQQRNSVLQRELLNTNRALTAGILANGVIHDVNNPLAIIMIKTEMLMNKINGSGSLDAAKFAEIKEGLQLINKEIERCRAITQRFLGLTRRSKDDHRESICVRNVLEDVLALLRAHPSANEKELVVGNVDQSLAIAVNTAEVLQLLVNLGINSLQAMRKGGQLKLSAGRLKNVEDELALGNAGNSTVFRSKQLDPKRPHVAINIADNGHGIPADALPHIFEPYFTTKPRGQGTGLGMAICTQLLDIYGGAIRVTSQVNAGTTCTVILPLA